LSNLENQKTIHEKELHFKQTDLERQKSLFDRGVIAAQEYEYKQLEYLQAERSLKNMSNSISITREAISSAHKTHKGTEIHRTKEEIVLLKNVIQSYHILKERLKDWELKYVLKSELEGNVTFLKVWSENQSVNQGDLVCTIVPSHQKQYVAKLKTPAFNSGKIKVGQLVHLKLDNYPETEFGMLQGEVQNISLTPDHEGLYIIDVKLPSQLITSYHKEIKFQQEMTATAEIITEDLVLIERLFYSFIKLGQR
jgi:multidrug resistance efflux pump